MELLNTIKTETTPLQEKKEVLENELVELKRNVDETKSAVSEHFIMPHFALSHDFIIFSKYSYQNV